jgi:hypothetical protein
VANITEKKEEYFAYHESAAGLILCAAKQSGLLEHVAEMHCSKAKYAKEGIHTWFFLILSGKGTLVTVRVCP